MDEDWDLHALVRSSSTDLTAAASAAAISSNTTIQGPFPNTCPTPFVKHDEDPFWFPNLSEPQNTNPFEELEKLYKPFFPTTTNTSSPPIITPPSSISKTNGFTVPKPHIHLQQQHQQHQFHQKPRASPAINPTFGPRSRKRKNQQKRVVQQVTAESLSADIWAWRKYGQKPIKGSPYPRNYYRCSSSKGCLARKQVERSHSDPTMFVITYTGEHSHPRPTHRNSLAGSTRNKYSTTAGAGATAVDTTVSSDNNNIINNSEQQQQPITNSPSPSLSPTTPLITPLTEEKINGGGDDDDGDEMENEEFDSEDLLIPNMAMNEDIFMGFQELGQGVPSSITHRRH